MQCLICKKHFRHLGSHVWHKHKILARDYKMQFGLDIGYSLIDDEIKEKKRVPWQDPKKRKKMLANLSDEHCFKKGVGGQRNYYSRQSIARFKENINKFSAKQHKQRCIVCNMVFDHLPSHLFNKHGLVIADEKKYVSSTK